MREWCGAEKGEGLPCQGHLKSTEQKPVVSSEMGEKRGVRAGGGGGEVLGGRRHQGDRE